MSPAMPPAERLNSLTQAEIDCLMRVLDHRTAKQIALEVGITHHAVEKRLKRAREKLGAQSSLEAARWAAEYYGRAVYGSSDLEPQKRKAEFSSMPSVMVGRKWRFQAMMTTTLALSLMLAGSNSPEPQSKADIATALENTLEQEFAIADANFERLDADSSGFIEKEEFISPFSEYLVKLQQDPLSARSARTGVVRFEADEVQIRYVDEAEEEAVIRLKDKRITERRQVKFGLIDRDEDGRIDQTEFRLSYLEGLGPKTFTVHLDKQDG